MGKGYNQRQNTEDRNTKSMEQKPWKWNWRKCNNGGRKWTWEANKSRNWSCTRILSSGEGRHYPSPKLSPGPSPRCWPPMLYSPHSHQCCCALSLALNSKFSVPSSEFGEQTAGGWEPGWEGNSAGSNVGTNAGNDSSDERTNAGNNAGSNNAGNTILQTCKMIKETPA